MQPNKHIENHKKRKPVTYASKPPVQKKIATAFTPLNNFDEDVDRQSLRKVGKKSLENVMVNSDFVLILSNQQEHQMIERFSRI